MKQQVAVIGLGRFGSAVAEELARARHDVLGIDSDLAVVQRLATQLPHVVQTDAADQQSLERLGVDGFDSAADILLPAPHLETPELPLD